MMMSTTPLADASAPAPASASSSSSSSCSSDEFGSRLVDLDFTASFAPASSSSSSSSLSSSLSLSAPVPLVLLADGSYVSVEEAKAPAPAPVPPPPQEEKKKDKVPTYAGRQKEVYDLFKRNGMSVARAIVAAGCTEKVLETLDAFPTEGRERTGLQVLDVTASHLTPEEVMTLLAEPAFMKKFTRIILAHAPKTSKNCTSARTESDSLFAELCERGMLACACSANAGAHGHLSLALLFLALVSPPGRLLELFKKDCKLSCKLANLSACIRLDAFEHGPFATGLARMLGSLASDGAFPEVKVHPKLPDPFEEVSEKSAPKKPEKKEPKKKEKEAKEVKEPEAKKETKKRKKPSPPSAPASSSLSSSSVSSVPASSSSSAKVVGLRPGVPVIPLVLDDASSAPVSKHPRAAKTKGDEDRKKADEKIKEQDKAITKTALLPPKAATAKCATSEVSEVKVVVIEDDHLEDEDERDPKKAKKDEEEKA